MIKKTSTNIVKPHISIHNASRFPHIPSRYYLQRWVGIALQQQKSKSAEVHIRLVDETESAELNSTYRHKSGPTNILSFPFEAPAGIPIPLLGDLIICAPLLAQEAKEQNKLLLAHWAHIVLHGTLHLLGYDHIKDEEAAMMEAIEIALLQQLGYPNPY